jgi:hypothetical protein
VRFAVTDCQTKLQLRQVCAATQEFEKTAKIIGQMGCSHFWQEKSTFVDSISIYCPREKNYSTHSTKRDGGYDHARNRGGE